MSSDLTRPTSANVAELRPDIRAKLERLLWLLGDRGLVPLVFETRRSLERAAYLKSIGRSKAGTLSLHVAPEGSTCRAADVVDGRKDSMGRLILWGGTFPGDTPELTAERTAMAREYFKAQGAAALEVGLTWGGGWHSFPDPAHLELT
jgi:hypothetical protein